MVVLEVAGIPQKFKEEEMVNFRRCVGRSRRKARGGKCLPRSRAEAVEFLEEELISRSAKGSNLIKKVFRGDMEKNKGDIVMLATDSSLRLLETDDYQVFGDGTFRYCPKFFHQLYTIHVFKDGYYVPVAYFLLNGQLFDIYKEMFEMLKPYGRLSVMTLDFENSTILAFKHVFPNSAVRGCRFHLAQAWQKKFREMGFQKQYNSRKGKIARFLKSLFGMPCLPANEVSEFFREVLTKNAPPQLKPFMNYLKKMYMMPNSTHPPHIWADVGHTNLKNTTNGCENFHRHFKDWFLSPKPNMYIFLSNLQLLDIQFGIRANSSRTVAPDECAQYIKQAWQKVTEGDLTRYQFIELCANLTQPIPPKSQRGTRKSKKVIKTLRKKLVTESFRRRSRRLRSRR